MAAAAEGAPALLPPLYGIVYEYLTPSEQWYAHALDQFRAWAVKKPVYEPEALKDAVVNNYLHIFLEARPKMSQDVTTHVSMINEIIKYDRIEMFKDYPYTTSLVSQLPMKIMQHGAIEIMRHTTQLGVHGFQYYAWDAALGGHLSCLQELKRIMPHYAVESDVYRAAVISCNAEAVRFIDREWPSSLEPGTWSARGGGESMCESARTVGMAKFMIEVGRERAGCFEPLLRAAFAADSVEMLGVVMAHAPKTMGISVEYAAARWALQGGALQKHLAHE